MEHLTILQQHPAVHLHFGWFNLSVPNIAFWCAAFAIFLLFAWLRIPEAIEASSKRSGDGE